MSRRPINRSPDLKRLRDEGYDIEVRAGFLVMHGVPYLAAPGRVERATIFTPLTLNDDVAQKPGDHQMFFVGETPQYAVGGQMTKLGLNGVGHQPLPGFIASHHFSNKPRPTGTYTDYHHKMSHYAIMLEGEAQVAQPGVTAKEFKPHRPDEADSVFLFEDTASSRADIVAVTEKLKLKRVDIIGAGGTGSYILDLVAKTPVEEIHIWDADLFLQHNAFRTPGAASSEELAENALKVQRLAEIYGKMRRGIIAHPVNMSPAHLDELEGTDFVFLSMEGAGKRPIIEKLETLDVAFIDVGLGVYVKDGRLGGLVRTTTSTAKLRSHVRDKKRISFVTADQVNEYDTNIQIAELNALNAAIAVIRWKKLMGFYADQEGEHNSLYAIGGNEITNEDQE
jgi:hypothetical protein